MNSVPLVSVVIPSYNHEKYVAESILSVINQTYSNIELIVIDDGSKDFSPNIIQNLSDEYGFYFERQSNMGLCSTLNRIVPLCKGEYICLFASDDVMLPNRIEVLMQKMLTTNKKCAAVVGDANFIDEHGNQTYWSYKGKKMYSLHEFFFASRSDISIENYGSYDTLIQGNYIPALSVLMRKDAVVDVGLYNSKSSMEDWDIWLKFSKSGYYMLCCLDVVSLYRWHGENSMIQDKDKLSYSSLLIFKREFSYCLKNKKFFLSLYCLKRVFKLYIRHMLKG